MPTRENISARVRAGGVDELGAAAEGGDAEAEAEAEAEAPPPLAGGLIRPIDKGLRSAAGRGRLDIAAASPPPRPLSSVEADAGPDASLTSIAAGRGNGADPAPPAPQLALEAPEAPDANAAAVLTAAAAAAAAANATPRGLDGADEAAALWPP